MEKKYEFTDETMELFEHTLHRIRAIKDFGDVKAGDLGGWIESELNLSQEGDCWIYHEAMVLEKARVFENAEVLDGAMVYGIAWVYDNANVHGHAKVCGRAMVYGNACVYGSALVYDKAMVHDCASVFAGAEVFGNAEVYGNATVCGKARVYENAEVFGSVMVYGDAKVCGNAEVYGEGEPKNPDGMDYKKLEENVMRHLDSMSDEELQADFDRHVERVDKWAKENPRAAEALGYDVPEEPKFKCFYLRGGKLSWSDHDANIKTMVKFIKNNESWTTEQFYDCLCHAVRCLDFAQQWKNEFQEMPWFYYDMEHLVGVRDVVYEFYSAVKYNINERLKDSLIDAIACIEWFGENLKNSPRNGRYKDFHEFDDFVLKRNPKYIQYLHCTFIRKAKQEEERLIRKAEENRKNGHPSDALLKPVSPASECQRKILYCEEEKNDESKERAEDDNLWRKIPEDVKEFMKRSSEMRKEKKTDNDTEPTALAKSPFPTREELDEVNRIGLAGVIKKRERQARWDAIWVWVMISLSSICGGVVGTVLYRWLRG